MMRMWNQVTVQEAESTGAPPPAIRTSPPTATPAVSPLLRDFLTWVTHQPRSYAEAMEAWRSSCPRFTIWEDALGDGLVRVQRRRGVTPAEMQVTLTPRGQAILHAD